MDVIRSPIHVDVARSVHDSEHNHANFAGRATQQSTLWFPSDELNNQHGMNFQAEPDGNINCTAKEVEEARFTRIQAEIWRIQQAENIRRQRQEKDRQHATKLTRRWTDARNANILARDEAMHQAESTAAAMQGSLKRSPVRMRRAPEHLMNTNGRTGLGQTGNDSALMTGACWANPFGDNVGAHRSSRDENMEQ